MYGYSHVRYATILFVDSQSARFRHGSADQVSNAYSYHFIFLLTRFYFIRRECVLVMYVVDSFEIFGTTIRKLLLMVIFHVILTYDSLELVALP